MVTLQLKQLSVPQGQRVQFFDVSWEDFEAILEELGEHRAARVAYFQGTLEIRKPLPEHERAKVVIGDLLKILLYELGMDWESFGSSTFKKQQMRTGIEPDNCFYIQNHQVMVGKRRLDLTIDPPPDLAIEVDVTSKTQLSAYEALRVPELWLYEKGKLQIYLLQNGEYVESQTSLNFLNFPVIESISQFVEMSFTAGTSVALRAFSIFVRERIS